MYTKALVIKEKVLGKAHPDYALSLMNLADLYMGTEQYEKAEPLFVEAKTILEKAVGKEHPNYALSLHNLASLYKLMGQYEKSELLYIESNEIEKSLLIKGSRHLSERELLSYTNKFIVQQNQFLSFAQKGSGFSKSVPFKLSAWALRRSYVRKRAPEGLPS